MPFWRTHLLLLMLAHLLDERHATAIAVDRFSQDDRDSIELSANGRIRLRREFLADDTTQANAKCFAFWLHVVRTPPQWAAATSPQSMLMPPEVRIEPTRRP